MKSNDYQNELSGFVALPNRMQYSLVEFARRIKRYIKLEQEKITPDNALISLLCNAAWLGWESIVGYQASLEKLEAAISASNQQTHEAICTDLEAICRFRSETEPEVCFDHLDKCSAKQHHA